FAEVRQVGEELKAACQQPAAAPLLERALQERPDLAPDLEELLAPRAAPTLVKYAAPSPYLEQSAADLADAARTHLGRLGEPERRHSVELAEPTANPPDEIAATLLYKHDTAGHSYRQVQGVVANLSDAQKEEILDLSLRHRGRHDDLLREHQAGY